MKKEPSRDTVYKEDYGWDVNPDYLFTKPHNNVTLLNYVATWTDLIGDDAAVDALRLSWYQVPTQQGHCEHEEYHRAKDVATPRSCTRAPRLTPHPLPHPRWSRRRGANGCEWTRPSPAARHV